MAVTGAVKRKPTRGTVSIYALAPSTSPSTLRRVETCFVRFPSSTTVRGPQTLLQFLLPQEMAGVLNKNDQQLEVPARQVQRLPVAEKQVLRRDENEGAETIPPQARFHENFGVRSEFRQDGADRGWRLYPRHIRCRV